MRGSLNYTEDEKPTCKTLKDYDLAEKFNMDFAFYASAFRNKKCLGTPQIKHFNGSII